MKNGILKLDWGSIIDAMLTAAVLAIVAGLVSVILGENFNIFTANWKLIGENAANWGLIGAFGSLSQDLLSDHQGNVLGIKTQ